MLENITDIPPQYSWENVDKSGPANHFNHHTIK